MRFLKRNPLLIAIAVLLIITSACAERPDNINLTLLYTNDIHGHIFPFEYTKLGNYEDETGGAARLGSLIMQLKDESKKAGNYTLVMDAGDTFTRGPVSDDKGLVDFEIMNLLPYDIMTLGNNEFKGNSGKAGLDNLRKRIAQAKFPIISGNILDNSTGKTLVDAYKIYNFDGVKVGVFGLSTSAIATYPQAEGLTVKNEFETAKTILQELEPKCDLIIALTHIGIDDDLALANMFPQIDVIVGGHTHSYLFVPMVFKREISLYGDKWIGGTLLCQDGEWGKMVGKLDMKLSKYSAKRYYVSSFGGGLVPVCKSIVPDENINKLVMSESDKYRQTVGLISEAVPFDKAAEWVARRMKEAANADYGVISNDSIESGLAAGAIKELSLRKMIPSDSEIALVKLTKDQLNDYIVECNGVVDKAIKQPDLSSQTITVAVEKGFFESSVMAANISLKSTGTTVRESIKKYLSKKK